MFSRIWNCGRNIKLLDEIQLLLLSGNIRWCSWWTHQISGDIFRVTGPLWGESTGHLWILLKKGQWRGVWMFSLIFAETNGSANNRDAGDLRRHRFILTSLWCYPSMERSGRFIRDMLTSWHWNALRITDFFRGLMRSLINVLDVGMNMLLNNNEIDGDFLRLNTYVM